MLCVKFYSDTTQLKSITKGIWKLELFFKLWVLHLGTKSVDGSPKETLYYCTAANLKHIIIDGTLSLVNL